MVTGRWSGHIEEFWAWRKCNWKADIARVTVDREYHVDDNPFGARRRVEFKRVPVEMGNQQNSRNGITNKLMP